MSNKGEKSRKSRLAREILGLFAATASISIFFFYFLSRMADSIVISYCEKNGIYFTEIQELVVDGWINNISFAASVVLFIVLFLFLIGQKLGYLREIIKGIEALRMHRMDHVIPVEGRNELTELAESINFLARTERELQLKEALMREEKEGLIRALSHDIRTPLTSILSFSEYMGEKENIEPKEIKEYADLMRQKAEQIKSLTDRLLDGGERILERFENGRFLMEQLADEWQADLEESFLCETDMKGCPQFSGEFDIQELRRIFDNLASNIKKYADPEKPVSLKIYEKEKRLLIEQKNKRRKIISGIESSGIGLESVRKIAEQYGGSIKVEENEEEFSIEIVLIEIM